MVRKKTPPAYGDSACRNELVSVGLMEALNAMLWYWSWDPTRAHVGIKGKVLLKSR